MTKTHPRKHHSGREVIIHKPSLGSSKKQWATLDSVVTVIPDGPLPFDINGIRLESWLTAPGTDAGWEQLADLENDFPEPTFVIPPEKRPATSAVILESDGRFWLVHPTNQFAGYEATFPKGTVDAECSLRATAVKECYEEAGLHIRLVGWLGDFPRSASFTRYYIAERIGGSPADMGWESQAVSLVPANYLRTLANSEWDQPVIDGILMLLMHRSTT